MQFVSSSDQVAQVAQVAQVSQLYMWAEMRDVKVLGQSAASTAWGRKEERLFKVTSAFSLKLMKAWWAAS